MSCLFSIVTPCYRGGGFLPRAFSSLVRQQGSHAFEWIIVDDFSNDCGQTRDAIRQVEKHAPFPVKSIFLDKNHYAAKSAYTGALHANGAYTIILDQDDMLAVDALHIFAHYIGKYEGTENFAGVCGRCTKLNGCIIGTPFPWSEKISNELHIRHVEKIRGEMLQCTKTALIVQYFSGMKPGYTNGWVWTRIARNYSYIYTSRIVRIYDTGNPDSTSNLKRMVHLDAQFATLIHYLTVNADYLRADPIFTLRLLVQSARIGIHMQKNLVDLISAVGEGYFWRLLSVLPLAYTKALRDRKVGRI